jgi:hypothetical protein
MCHLIFRDKLADLLKFMQFNTHEMAGFIRLLPNFQLLRAATAN